MTYISGRREYVDYWHGIMVIQSRHKTNCYHRRVDSMAIVAASPSWLEGYVQEYNKIVTWRFLMPSKPIEWSTSLNEGRSSQFSRHELEKYRSGKVNLCTHKEFMKTEEKTWSQLCSFWYAWRREYISTHFLPFHSDIFWGTSLNAHTTSHSHAYEAVHAWMKSV